MSTTATLPEVGEITEEESLEELDKLYHVILLNDEDHTYDYVVEMLMKLFHFSEAKAFRHTVEVDTVGHTRLITTGLTEAEKKRDQIHAYGADWRLERSVGSMAALIEPAE